MKVDSPAINWHGQKDRILCIDFHPFFSEFATAGSDERKFIKLNYIIALQNQLLCFFNINFVYRKQNQMKQSLSTTKLFNLFLSLLLFFQVAYAGCDHPIFCSQQILAAVANSNYYKDSKQFVDRTLKVPINQALGQFQIIQMPSKINQLKIFSANVLVIQIRFSKISIFLITRNFPNSLKKIKSQDYTTFALDMNLRWNQLAKKVNLKVKDSTCSGPLCSSFIPEMDSRTIIIPGGRFRQAYYWDTYWIIKGLLVCQLYDTAQELIYNFLIVLTKYGFVPNGFRVYFLNRSQPPFLSLMVKDLTDSLRLIGRQAKADKIERDMYPILIAQHSYWMDTHMQRIKIDGKQFTLNKYNVDCESPRPQSYKQDVQIAKNLSSEQKKKLFKEISTIAQSGWDFSSRWLKDSQSILTAEITNIIPSDLNAIIGISEQYLVELSQKFQKETQKQYFMGMIQMRKEYFSLIKKGEYYPDFYKQNAKKKRDLYPTDLLPHIFLGTQITYNPYKQLVNPPSSQTQNGQQWDYPNVWAPNSWILHQVLNKQQERFKVAEQWVKTTYCSWKKQYAIYQKYRTDAWGVRGEGGQYEVQTGFGWSNGLALYYIQLYGEYFDDPKC